ncbi:hypothetical protein [Mycolicibacterium llatzerense]|uniref:hypothetical protein n=1 Tax=Mycolicibacterium llatzerense TaxID=280871 RepID=UPI0021B5CDF6|nr:hypothetical protein [Mycolicibacterium llatzerense]MCT7372149.1 hypothetical protein [Mycolicibacterium llatzerense]
MITLLSLGGFANHCGLAFGTVRRYHAENRLPQPDGELIDGKGNSRPVWFPETADNWQRPGQRPGQGARTDLKQKAD